jgi:hypothetical protein
MAYDDADGPSIADVLAGRCGHDPRVRITPGQRLYYHYRLDRHSYETERATAHRPPAPRDFHAGRDGVADAA